jgi:adenosylcobyric acid synthase
MQLLGMFIDDPQNLEAGGMVPGLGLLDIHTELVVAKTTREVDTTISDTGERVSGYEIHHGETTAGRLAISELDGRLGWRQDNVAGIYVHGLLDDTAYRRRFLHRVGVEVSNVVNRAAAIDVELNRITAAVVASGWCDQVERRLADRETTTVAMTSG